MNPTGDFPFWPFFPFGVLYGITIGLAFLVFRFGMNRIIASAMTLLLMTSSFHLSFLVPAVLYDYPNAPFFLFIVLMMLVFLTMNPRGKVTLLIVIASASLIRFANFTRPDVIVLILPFLVTILIFKKGGSYSWRFKMVASILFFITFLLVPGHSKKIDKSTNLLRFFLGLSEPVNCQLGIDEASYRHGYLYSDDFAVFDTLFQERTPLTLDSEDALRKSFTKNGVRHLGTILKTFPLDLTLRAYASSLQVLDLPFIYLLPPLGIDSEIFKAFYALKGFFLSLFSGWGWLLFLVAFTILFHRNRKHGIYFALLVLYLTSYPSAQFLGRHYFHLEFVPLWILGFLIHEIWHFGYSFLIDWRNFSKSFAIGLAGLTILLLFPLFISATIQYPRIQRLFTEYQSAKKIPLKTQFLDLNDQITKVVPNQAIPDEKSIDQYVNQMLILRFKGDSETPQSTPIIIRYDYDKQGPLSSRRDFSYTVQVRIPSKSEEATELFVPIAAIPSSMGGIRFSGVELSTLRKNSLDSIYLVSPRTPLTTYLRLELHHRQSINRRRQSISWIWDNSTLAVPTGIHDVQTFEKVQPIEIRVSEKDLFYRDPNVKTRAKGWKMSGYALPPKDAFFIPALDRSRSKLSKLLRAQISVGVVDTDLILTKEFQIPNSFFLVADGILYNGGMIIGILRNGIPIGYKIITRRGRFRVIIKAQEGGAYRLGIANYLNFYTSLENRFVLKSIMWKNRI